MYNSLKCGHHTFGTATESFQKLLAERTVGYYRSGADFKTFSTKRRLGFLMITAPKRQNDFSY